MYWLVWLAILLAVFLFILLRIFPLRRVIVHEYQRAVKYTEVDTAQLWTRDFTGFSRRSRP